MIKQEKRAFYTMIISGLLLLYLVTDFIITGVDGFLERTNFLATSAVILIAMIGFGVLIYVTSKSNEVTDERDNSVMLKASNNAIIVITMFVFVLMIGLYLVYEEAGLIPVSWAWFVAYVTFAFAYFITSIITVVLYKVL